MLAPPSSASLVPVDRFGFSVQAMDINENGFKVTIRRSQGVLYGVSYPFWKNRVGFPSGVWEGSRCACVGNRTLYPAQSRGAAHREALAF
jgi:hypothetical protein